MLTTLRGTVELDPMRVPAPAAMTSGRDTSFENVLQEAVDGATQAEVEPEPAAAPAEEAPAEEPVVEDEAAEEQAERYEQPASGADHDTAQNAIAQPAATTADATETIRRGESARQETAGKGTDSPRTSTRTAEPLLAAFVVHGATPQPNGPVVAAGQAGVQGVTGAKATGDGPTRGIDAAWQRANTPSRAAAVAAGYRTGTTVAQAQQLEDARDSVFKQILMKLNPGGGEMHMRLDPPELGELDLHMVVENGNRLSLSIAAERQDMTQLLQRHLDELKQTLQAAGLEVADAQVHQREPGSRGQRQAPERQSRGDSDDGAAARQHLPRRGGYVTAEGLDFWV